MWISLGPWSDGSTSGWASLASLKTSHSLPKAGVICHHRCWSSHSLLFPPCWLGVAPRHHCLKFIQVCIILYSMFIVWTQHNKTKMIRSEEVLLCYFGVGQRLLHWMQLLLSGTCCMHFLSGPVVQWVVYSQTQIRVIMWCSLNHGNQADRQDQHKYEMHLYKWHTFKHPHYSICSTLCI